MSSCNVEALTMERFTAHCPFIFLLMLGNNSKDGKVMWEMNVGRDKIIKKSLTKRWMEQKEEENQLYVICEM